MATTERAAADGEAAKDIIWEPLIRDSAAVESAVWATDVAGDRNA